MFMMQVQRMPASMPPSRAPNMVRDGRESVGPTIPSAEKDMLDHARNLEAR